MEWMLVGRTLSQSALGLGRALSLRVWPSSALLPNWHAKLGVSPETTSEHHSRLRRAGLVEPYHSGRSASSGGMALLWL